MATRTPDEVRAAALEWLARTTFDGDVAVTREQLTQDFVFDGVRFPLVDTGRGIRKPAGWDAALSILTAVPKSGDKRPYDDREGADGLHRYKLRRDARGASENEGLRAAMRRQLPLVWFYGLRPGVFQAIFPVYLVAEEAAEDQFVLALTDDQRQVTPGSVIEEATRRYLVSQTRRRLHQRVFSGQVMLAYDTRCAVCDLHHRRLLDAAHITPDVAERGIPVVSNGLALCKIHHAAFDSNVLGITPDYEVRIHQRLLDEIDGPMLRHGLQDHHGRSLMRVPRRRAEVPDRDRLAERFAEFRAA